MAIWELLNITRCSGKIFHENLRSMIRPHSKKKCLLKCSSFLSSRTIERTRKKKRKLCLLFVILYRMHKNSQKVLLYASIQHYFSVRGPRAWRIRATPLFGSRVRQKKNSTKKKVDFSTKIVLDSRDWFLPKRKDCSECNGQAKFNIFFGTRHGFKCID